jgi:RNA-directed DNA polymerase
VIAAGYPGFGPGDNINLRSGEVSSFFRKSLVDYVEVTQKLLQGASGGPLLDSQGRVAGVIHKGGPLIERDHAVHVDMVFEWFEEIARSAGPPRNT